MTAWSFLKTRDKCDEMKQWPMAILGNASSTMPYTLSPPVAWHKPIPIRFHSAEANKDSVSA